MKAVAFARTLVMLVFLFYFPSLKTAAQTISGIINAYYKVTAVNTGTGTLTLTTTAGLTPGNRVLIIQMKGAAIDGTNTASFGNVTAINDAGNYEFNYICGINGNDVLLQANLIRTYNPPGSVQLVTVPQYNIVTVTDTLTASPWNSASGTGGIVVLEADTLNLNSVIDVRGKGFAGGGLVNFPLPTYDCSIINPVNQFFMGLPASGNFSAAPKGEGIADFLPNAAYARGKQANGGGGGNNHNAGGSGGGNYSAGGNGGTRSNVSFPNCTGTFPGIAGLSLSSFGYIVGNNRIFLGGGGGAGHENNAVGTPGGNGGGIAIITANVVSGAGTGILAGGNVPYNAALAVDPFSSGGDGGGGGGAGGTIILNINEVTGNIVANATGAKGSDAGRTGAPGDCPGPGGGGGGGVVWMKGGSVIANVTANTNGGVNGVVSLLSVTVACRGNASGAAPGTNGAVLTGYVPNLSTPFTCAPLPVRELKSFTGKIEQEGIKLKWNMNTIDGIAVYELERSVNQVNYAAIYTVNNNNEYSFSYTDRAISEGTVYYRLKITRVNGTVNYAALRLTKNTTLSFQLLDIHPNPAGRELRLSVRARKNSAACIRIYNNTGQIIYTSNQRVLQGYSKLTIPVSQLPQGLHWVVVEAEGIRMTHSFVKGF